MANGQQVKFIKRTGDWTIYCNAYCWPGWLSRGHATKELALEAGKIHADEAHFHAGHVKQWKMKEPSKDRQHSVVVVRTTRYSKG